jgi:hypothetical protein
MIGARPPADGTGRLVSRKEMLNLLRIRHDQFEFAAARGNFGQWSLSPL